MPGIRQQHKRPSWHPRCRTWLAAALFGLCLPVHGADPDAGIDERRLKVALIYNFSQFVDWPDAALGPAGTPFRVCVAGTDPFGKFLLALQSRNHLGHPIQVSHPATLDEARKCHILYVDEPATTFLGRDVGKALGDAAVLTISSSDGALAAGVGIGFVPQAERIRWSMDLNAVRRAQLKVSAKLIEIAVSVVGERAK